LQILKPKNVPNVTLNVLYVMVKITQNAYNVLLAIFYSKTNAISHVLKTHLLFQIKTHPNAKNVIKLVPNVKDRFLLIAQNALMYIFLKKTPLNVT
jgi:hypothetical protein